MRLKLHILVSCSCEGWLQCESFTLPVNMLKLMREDGDQKGIITEVSCLSRGLLHFHRLAIICETTVSDMKI